ncbi:hypothetical protein E2C01_015959 [Portunus trituberculatus]|uniref:Uncharacterized protein n=1 Tax=Portunus trituberculatus TaxID=210409 RepID=A0A5B7DNA8_PORTR|nr:hypothetical protein [Portunus trituberculatus]
MLGNIAGRFGGKLSERRRAAADAVIVLNRLKLIFERQEIVLLRAGAGGSFARHGQVAWRQEVERWRVACLESSWGESDVD